ncbi:hypothetical protein K438DRAFT_1779657 [Mycena galopus ATCC 62051]|nr:hypothetical protein K438DRAFT_1779657 [Mycena galopus ATCC 62051]
MILKFTRELLLCFCLSFTITISTIHAFVHLLPHATFKVTFACNILVNAAHEVAVRSGLVEFHEEKQEGQCGNVELPSIPAAGKASIHAKGEVDVRLYMWVIERRSVNLVQSIIVAPGAILYYT